MTKNFIKAARYVLRQRMIKQARQDFSKVDLLNDLKAVEALLRSSRRRDWDAAYDNFMLNNSDTAQKELFEPKSSKHIDEGQKYMLEDYLRYKHNLPDFYWQDDETSFIDCTPCITDEDARNAHENRGKFPLTDEEKDIIRKYMDISGYYSPFEKDYYLRMGNNAFKRLYWDEDTGKDYYPSDFGSKVDAWTQEDMDKRNEAYFKMLNAYDNKLSKLIGRKYN